MTSLSIWGVYEFLQSKYVGQIASSRIQKLIQPYSKAKVTFEHIELGFFPPRTIFKNVNFSDQSLGVNQLHIGSIDLHFGIIDLLSQKLSIGSLGLHNAIIDLQRISSHKTDTSKNKKNDLFSYFNNYKDLRKKLPFIVRGLNLSEIMIVSDDNKVDIKEFKASFKTDHVNVIATIDHHLLLLKKYSLLPKGEISLNLDYHSDRLTFNEVEIFNGFDQLKLAGSLLNNNDFQINSFSSNLNLKRYINQLYKLTGVKEVLPRGDLSVSGHFARMKNRYQGEFSFKGRNLDSKFYRLGLLDGKASIEKGKFILKEARVKTQKGEAKLLSPAEFVDIKRQLYLEPKLNLDLKKIHTSEFLFFVDAFNYLEFVINGKTALTFGLDFIQVNPEKGGTLRDFQLMSKGGTKILSQKKIELREGNQVMISYDGRVDLDTRVKFQESHLNSNVTIANREIKANIFDSYLDFEEVGPISGFIIRGKGPVKGEVYGSLDKVFIPFNADLTNFGFLDFFLGKAKGDLVLEISDDLSLKIDQLEGESFDNFYLAKGGLFFERENNLDLDIEFKKGNFKGLKQMAPELFVKTKPYTDYLRMGFSAQAKLTGKFAPEKMDLKAKLKGNSFFLFEESFQQFKSEVDLKDYKLAFKNIELIKPTGKINGEMDFNLGEGSFYYQFATKKVRLNDFKYYRDLPTEYLGNARSKLSGIYNGKVLKGEMELDVFDSRLGPQKVDDSRLVIKQLGDRYDVKGSFLGEEILVNSRFFWDRKKEADVNLRINSQKLEHIIAFFKEYSLSENNLTGPIELGFKSKFSYQKPEAGSYHLRLKRLGLRNPQINVQDLPPWEIVVKNGRIKEWRADWRDTPLKLSSNADGKLGKDFKAKTLFSFDASLLKAVEPKILKATGPIDVVSSIKTKNKKIEHQLSFFSKGVDLQVKAIPGWIKAVRGKALYRHGEVAIDSIQADYGGGEALLSGRIIPNLGPFEYDLDLDLSKSRVDFYNKSYVVISGKTHFSGDDYPYLLKGNVDILYGEVLEEMDTLTASAISNESYKKFLPKGYLSRSTSFINNEIDVRILSPIRVRNGLLDLALGGNLHVFSSITSPKMKGDVYTSGRSSKFLFKGHEFLLKEGNISLTDSKEEKKKPELKFNGTTRINNYDVSINVTGPTNNILLELNSSPALSQEDILSLLTLGVTSDISKNLDDKERQSLTGLSVGSLIVDQLKINQKLNDSLGVRLSVQPEFIDQDTSLLEGRTTEGNTTSQVRSSTSVKVQKNLGKRANVSISSTVGGTVSQKQEMNLNYSITPKWSLEGVYEIRSNDDLETQTQESAGADLKYIWSFK